MPRLLLSCFSTLLAACCAFGQGIPPIGQWREHLPFNNAVAVQQRDGVIHCATPYGYFTYTTASATFTRRSKINGLSEVRVAGMAIEPGGERVLIWYENGNMDFIDGDEVINLPDVQQSTVPGDKRIADALWRGNRVFLAAGLGIIVLDTDKYEVRDTWRPSSTGADIRVDALAADATYLYAATAEGLRQAPVSGANLADFRNWQTVSGNGLSAGPCEDVAISGGRLALRRQDTVFIRRGSQWDRSYRSAGQLVSLDTATAGLLVGELSGGRGRVTVLDTAGTVTARLATASIALPRQALQDGSTFWVADQNNGLLRVEAALEERVFPNSPISTASGDMIFAGRELWVAAGSVNDAWNYTFNPNGLSRFSGDFWTGVNLYVYPQIDSLLDFITLARNPVSGNMFAGSFGGGLLEIGQDGRFTIYKQQTGLQEAIGDPGSYRVGGLAADRDGNLWIANYGAPQDLVLRKADGSWKRFGIPFLHTENAVGQVLIDELNQKWIQSPKGNGVFCFDDAGTPDNISDDRWRYFRAGRGNGNLPSNDVFCLAMDRNGFIWIGTARGIAVVQCPQEVFASNACEAVLPVVQQDNFAGFLFRDEEVRTIAVDGANRKWVGTRNGVWLISPDGQQVISRFTETNSPLLSDIINRIAIDPATGEVFISTFNGICSFRGTSTQAATSKDSVLVFPNPVPPGFSGTIAIRGLPQDAWVKITELDGRLVYQTRALGGQAVWDGRNYKGERASSGVYLVLVADETNREKLVTKIFFIR